MSERRMECGAPLRGSLEIEDEDQRLVYEVMWGNHGHTDDGRCMLVPLGSLELTPDATPDARRPMADTGGEAE